MTQQVDTPQDYLTALHGNTTYEVCAMMNDRGHDWLTLGLFNDAQTAGRAANEYDGRAAGLYVTVNPVSKYALNPDHLKRSRTRVSSNDIRSRSYWYIDVDQTNRLPGTNATNPEHDAALKTRVGVAQYITSRGGPDPFVMGDSGNGGYLVYKLPNRAGDITRAHRGLCALLSGPYIKLDPKVTDLARLHPLVGTLKCKGPHTTERPQRRTWAEIDTKAGEIPSGLLAELAELWQIDITPGKPGVLVEFQGDLLPQQAIDFLTDPPKPGQRNTRLFDTLRSLRDTGTDEGGARSLLTEAALAVGFTLPKFGSVLKSVYTYTGHSSLERERNKAFIETWREHVIAQTGGSWAGRTGQTHKRVALAVAEIAAIAGKCDFHASVRDVGVGACVGFKAASEHLKILRHDDGLLRATNLGQRDTPQAIKYALTLPDTANKASPVTGDTLREPRVLAPSPPSSLSVSPVTGDATREQVLQPHVKARVLSHELTSTKLGGCMAAIVLALFEMGELSPRKMQTLTGRRMATCIKALGALADVGMVKLAAEFWSLTTDDPARWLAAFDVLAVRFKAVGRREDLRRRYALDRDQFIQVEARLGDQAVAVCDEMRAKRELAKKDARERKRQQAGNMLRARVNQKRR